VVTLFKYDSPRNEVLETGTITADKLEGPMMGKQLSDPALAGAHGTLYINIHTEQNPNGEIRGQIQNP
jgi:hypothetical protein